MGVLRKELEPGLHISRRSRDDFYRFLRVARFFTCFVRLREAGPALPPMHAMCTRAQAAGCCQWEKPCWSRLMALLQQVGGNVLEHRLNCDQVGAALP
jgi:hypothetical protein